MRQRGFKVALIPTTSISSRPIVAFTSCTSLSGRETRIGRSGW
jgi:hypothetical protein